MVRIFEPRPACIGVVDEGRLYSIEKRRKQKNDERELFYAIFSFFFLTGRKSAETRKKANTQKNLFLERASRRKKEQDGRAYMGACSEGLRDPAQRF